MINKIFLRKVKLKNQKKWRSGVGSRENTEILLRSIMLREWSIARSIERAWIETNRWVAKL